MFARWKEAKEKESTDTVRQINSQMRQLEQNVEGMLADVVRQVNFQISKQDEAIAKLNNEVRQIQVAIAAPKKRPLQLEGAKGSVGAEESEKKPRPDRPKPEPPIKPMPISEGAKKVPHQPKTPPPPKMLETRAKSASSSSQPVKAPQLRQPPLPLPLHGVTKIVKVVSLKKGKDQPVAKVDFEKKEEKKESESEKHLTDATTSSKSE